MERYKDGDTWVLTLLLLEYGFGDSKKPDTWALKTLVLTLLLLEYGFGVHKSTLSVKPLES